MSTSRVAPRTLPAVQRERARTMRTAATPAERKLWSRLRASSLDGHKFSRQIAVGPYIADLVCRRLKLVVEVDGGQHGGDDDHRRTRFLEAHGYTVLRFWNVEVLQEIDGVLTTILAALQAAAGAATPPPPAPPASGRGARW